MKRDEIGIGEIIAKIVIAIATLGAIAFALMKLVGYLKKRGYIHCGCGDKCCDFCGCGDECCECDECCDEAGEAAGEADTSDGAAGAAEEK